MKLTLLLTALLLFPAAPRPAIDLTPIRLPEGFTIELYTDEVPGARSMTLGDNGTLFVGTRPQGNVYAVVDADGDGKPEQVHTILEYMNVPCGVAFRDGSLYVAEIDTIWRLDDIESKLAEPPEPELVFDDLPSERHHGWKFIAFGPDGLLYVPIGAPGNIVLREDDPRFASISRLKPDGTGFEVFASGVRNTVGFDFHPETGELWFTDNGRDWLGDDSPPDELNRAPAKGLHFGFPFLHGADTKDPEFGEQAGERKFTPPARALAPHCAALGMRFYDGEMFPKEYRHQVFIAEHGSWNRSEPIGYRVTLVTFEDGKPVSYEPFAEGWLGEDGETRGRPVDVQVMPDGALLVSDDHAGAIYRISYAPPAEDEE